MLHPIIFYLITFAICIVTGLYDIPACVFMALIAVCSILYARIGPKDTQSERYSLGAIITLIYIFSSIITSSCFSESEYYLASDPIRYIAMVHYNADYNLILGDLERAYIALSDNNGLYNAMLKFLGILCKDSGHEASSLVITLPQTLFGILTIQTVFRILCLKFNADKSFKYTILYGLCSITLLYSGIIVRDIVIAFLFAVCLETVLKPFKVKGLVVLGFAMVV